MHVANIGTKKSNGIIGHSQCFVQWCKKSYILAVNKFNGSHTAERIRSKIMGLLADWKVSLERCHVFMRDGDIFVKLAMKNVIYTPLVSPIWV
jgi:hypothetical protein